MMRLSTLLLSLAAVSAVAIPTWATAQQTRSSPAAVTPHIDEQAKEALSEVQVRGQARRYRLDPDEARKVAGTYGMSNGWTIRVIPRRGHVLLSINEGPPVQLFPQSPDKFASADGNIATVFNLGMMQDDVVMSYVPDARLSDQRIVLGSGSLAAR